MLEKINYTLKCIHDLDFLISIASSCSEYPNGIQVSFLLSLWLGLNTYYVHGSLRKEDKKEKKMVVLVILSCQFMTFSHSLGEPHPQGTPPSQYPHVKHGMEWGST